MLKEYKCETHGNSVLYDDEKKSRNYTTAPGSYSGGPPCMLLLLPFFVEGDFNGCHIVEVKKAGE